MEDVNWINWFLYNVCRRCKVQLCKPRQFKPCNKLPKTATAVQGYIKIYIDFNSNKVKVTNMEWFKETQIDKTAIKQFIKAIIKKCMACSDQECKQLPLKVVIFRGHVHYSKVSTVQVCKLPKRYFEQIDHMEYLEQKLKQLQLQNIDPKAPDHFEDQAVWITNENNEVIDAKHMKCTN